MNTRRWNKKDSGKKRKKWKKPSEDVKNNVSRENESWIVIVRIDQANGQTAATEDTTTTIDEMTQETGVATMIQSALTKNEAELLQDTEMNGIETMKDEKKKEKEIEKGKDQGLPESNQKTGRFQQDHRLVGKRSRNLLR